MFKKLFLLTLISSVGSVVMGADRNWSNRLGASTNGKSRLPKPLVKTSNLAESCQTGCAVVCVVALLSLRTYLLINQFELRRD